MNLAVKNLDKSVAFFQTLGFTCNPLFTDNTAGPRPPLRRPAAEAVILNNTAIEPDAAFAAALAVVRGKLSASCCPASPIF